MRGCGGGVVGMMVGKNGCGNKYEGLIGCVGTWVHACVVVSVLAVWLLLTFGLVDLIGASSYLKDVAYVGISRSGKARSYPLQTTNFVRRGPSAQFTYIVALFPTIPLRGLFVRWSSCESMYVMKVS